MAQPPPPSQRLTELAKKYGHPIGPLHLPLTITRDGDLKKSGLTPLDPSADVTIQQKVLGQALEEHQRLRFFGFTTAEIEAVEALAPRYVHNPALLDDTLPIHPLLARENWDPPLPRHLAPFPLGNGRRGYWEAHNPIVWNAIAPSLRLATLFLENAGTWPWWDALAFGIYSDIHDHELPKNGAQYRTRKFARFRHRAPNTFNWSEERKRLQKRFLKMATKLQIQIISGRADRYTGLPQQNSLKMNWGAMIPPNTFHAHAIIYLNYEMMEPLVDNKRLNSAERATDIFRLACVILHEIAHTFWELELRQEHPELEDEPYFEDEVTSELGFSLENALFGGVSHPLRHFTRGNLHSKSAGGGIISTWDTINDAKDSPGSLVLIPRPGVDRDDYNSFDFAPVPSAYYLALLRSEFWRSYVKSYGPRSTFAGPKLIGSRGLGDGSGRNRVYYNIEDIETVELPISQHATTAERVSLREENARRKRARRIYRSITRLTTRMETVTAANQQAITNDPVAQDMLEKFKFMPDLPLDATQEDCRVWDMLLCSFYDEAEKAEQHENAMRAQCPRFKEIEDYLFKNRFKLALDTMQVPMAEHVLYNHILENGGLNINADEWHEFCLICRMNNRLFRYKEMGYAWGVLYRVEKGWPAISKLMRSRPLFYRPSNEVLDMFRKVSQQVLMTKGVFEGSYCDHDWEDFRRRLNFLYKLNPKYPVHDRLGVRVKKFSKRLFAAALYYNYRSKNGIEYGPKGVLRWVDLYPEVPPDKAKLNSSEPSTSVYSSPERSPPPPTPPPKDKAPQPPSPPRTPPLARPSSVQISPSAQMSALDLGSPISPLTIKPGTINPFTDKPFCAGRPARPPQAQLQNIPARSPLPEADPEWEEIVPRTP